MPFYIFWGVGYNSRFPCFIWAWSINWSQSSHPTSSLSPRLPPQRFFIEKKIIFIFAFSHTPRGYRLPGIQFVPHTILHLISAEMGLDRTVWLPKEDLRLSFNSCQQSSLSI